jgi:hypothetical protein
MQKRQRKLDALASPLAIRTLLHKLYVAKAAIFPKLERDQITLLNAMRHATRKPENTKHRGRPSPWNRAELWEIKQQLQHLLELETQGRVSCQTFICQYLPILYYPAELIDGLAVGHINRQEALALARLSANRLEKTEAEAQEIRLSLLKAHVSTQGSQNQLRQRVQQLLGENTLVSRETLALGIHKMDALLEISDHDVRHVFFETIKELFYALRTIESNDLSDANIEDFTLAADSLSNTIRTIQHDIAQRKSAATQTNSPAANALAEPQLQIFNDPATGQVSYRFQ